MIKLTIKEQEFLDKQLKKEKIYLCFCLLDIILVIGMLIYMIFQGTLDSTRFILMLILLINAKMNFKQYKNIKLLKKLSS